ncbi:hypothetical protein C7S18_11365 [Ahniella affigens]|uniref:Uncharacterized protein n=1 Tax=Ahniella affigens TaxID=2021234 RepID=A0A2P1PSD1_9GAMM|nr:hypothetical protein C7S18_11365 [Ahniella affigens]
MRLAPLAVQLIDAALMVSPQVFLDLGSNLVSPKYAGALLAAAMRRLLSSLRRSRLCEDG